MNDDTLDNLLNKSLSGESDISCDMEDSESESELDHVSFPCSCTLLMTLIVHRMKCYLISMVPCSRHISLINLFDQCCNMCSLAYLRKNEIFLH